MADLNLIFHFVIHLTGTILLGVYTSLLSLFHQAIPYKYRCKSIRGETALVTGAGSGIGKLMSKKLANLGVNLILVDVDEKNNKKTAEEIIADGGNAKTFTCDLSKREEIYRVCSEIKKTADKVDILVNNAGIVSGRLLLDTPDSAIERTFQVNVFAHFWLCKQFLPAMIESNHGHIVTIASMAGLVGAAQLCDYCSSKFAAVGFDESLRNELLLLDKTGVKTTLVCPFYIDTGMFHGADSHVVPFLKPEYAANKIIEAILTDQEVLYMPKIMYFIMFLKGILSNAHGAYLSKHVFKTCYSMTSFIGRNKEKENKIY